MVAHVRTFGLSGITGFSVDAEINIAKGLPDFDIIGMGNMAVREAAGRIRAALENSGYPFPLGRVTVNLAPAGIRKEGACYDLAIAVGILLCGSYAGVRTDAFIRPNEGACKVYIFPDCTRLNEKDQNVLLKTVEEGPPYAAFLFCAENASVLLPTIRSRCVEVKLPPAGTVGEDDERTRELLRLIAEGRAAARAAFLLKLETAKATREELAALFEGARVILADALCTLCGAPPAEPRDEQALRAVLGSRLTKAQILGTIELLETYRNHCEYNVGVGPLLGGLAVELEEIL